MGKVEKMMTVFTAEAEIYTHEQHINGKKEQIFVRQIEVTLNSEYGEYATNIISVDEAKEIVKVLQAEIKKASKSDKQILADEEKRMKSFRSMIESLRTREATED